MMKYLVVILVALLALAAPVAAVTLTGLSQTHGETWIKWVWNQSPVTPTAGFLFTEVDGKNMGVLNLTSTPSTLVPMEYYLTDLQPNEKHTFRVYIWDNATLPGTVVASTSLSTTTSQPGTYNWMIFILALILLGASLFMTSAKSATIPILLATTSGILNLYLSTAVFETNSSFSTVCLIAAVIAGGLILYMFYWAWEDKNTWRDTP